MASTCLYVFLVLNPLALQTEWKELGCQGDTRTSSIVATLWANGIYGNPTNSQHVVATIKIFSDETEYNKYCSEYRLLKK